MAKQKHTQHALYVGLDVSLKKIDVHIMTDAKERLNQRTREVTNTPAGIHSLARELVKHAKDYQADTILVGFEATGNYAFHIPFALKENETLEKFDLQIFQINPKIIKNFRKVYNALPKTDSYDSFLIAERLRLRKLPPYTRFEPKYHALRTLTRTRFSLAQKIASEKSRFISTLFLKASGFSQEKAFSNLFGATSLSFITELSPEEIVDASIDELVTRIVAKSKNKIKTPASYAERLKYIARESYCIDRVMHDSVTYALMASHRHIKFLTGELKSISNEIERFVSGAFKDERTILTSIKGIGGVFAAGIIAEVGGVENFTSQEQLAKFSGIIWSVNQSGQFKAEESSLTKAGNKYLRYYLVQAAQSVVTHNDDFKPYYRKKYLEATKHKHKRAVVFVARKLVRVMFSLLKNRKLYESPKKLAAK